MPRKNSKKNSPLDTETTFVNMNVEGFKWYHPETESNDLPPLTKKEAKALMLGAYSAMLPLIIGVLAVTAVIAVIAYLWLA